MSQENVEVVRRVQEAFEAGVEARDFGAAWDTGAVTDDSELVPAPEVPGEAGQATYRGREEFAEFMRRWTEDLEHWSARTERLIDAPGDRVVAFMRQSGIGKGSGVPVDLRYGAVFQLEGGLIVRTRLYLHPEEALEAAGLSE
jgi:ketosteroid isomerase-like protein